MAELSKETKKYFRRKGTVSTWWNPDGIAKYDRQIDFINDIVCFKDKAVLDVGCGKGRFLVNALKLGAKRCCGLDISAEMLEITKKESDFAGQGRHCYFSLSDAENLCIGKEQFDIVICMELFVHLQNPSSVMAELARVCKSKGVLVTNINLKRPGYLQAIMNTFEGIYYSTLFSFIRPFMFGKFNIPEKRRMKTTETMELLSSSKGKELSRPSDALHRMKKSDFLDLLECNGFTARHIHLSGNRIFPVFSQCMTLVAVKN